LHENTSRAGPSAQIIKQKKIVELLQNAIPFVIVGIVLYKMGYISSSNCSFE